jgi:ABC-type molybdate transport system ATPase subunit
MSRSRSALTSSWWYWGRPAAENPRCCASIAGLETIDAGEIEIDGARVDHLPPGKRGVAMVFQGYALYPAHDGTRATSPSA